MDSAVHRVGTPAARGPVAATYRPRREPGERAGARRCPCNDSVGGKVMALILVAVIAVGLAGLSVLLAGRSVRSRSQLHEATAALREASAEIAALRGNETHLVARVAELEAEDRRKAGWLDHHEKELDWLRKELDQRPKVTRKIYKILTLGVSGTGKTALTLKWANPLVDLGTLQGTKIERYERVVSRATGRDVAVEHVFEIGDWGGEHMVDAQHELVMEEVHGLLIVVDLAKKGSSTLDTDRVQEQLCELQPQTLRFFFGPNMSASCKTVVLFINKSDVLSGTPAEVEREARRHYQRLVADLDAFKAQLDVRVLVGSAQYGHATHDLFAHFVERVLPRSAYDNQLLQQMKSDVEPSGRGGAPGQPAPLASTHTQPLTPHLPAGLPVAPPKMVAPSPPGRPSNVLRK